MKIPQKVKDELKEPLGKVYDDYKEVVRLSRTKKIVSVGDVCTLGLLQIGIMPHLAIFDYKSMRKKLDIRHMEVLKRYFPKAARLKNPAGTISDFLIKNSKRLLKQGGGILIDGEEDLTALAFIENAGPKFILIYGQPNEGLVIVKMDDKTKKKVSGLLSIALAHKVK